MFCPTPELTARAPVLTVSRRQILTGFASLAGASAAIAIPVEPLTRRGTPQLTTGPFYPLDRPFDQDWDLTRVHGGRGVAQGIIMELQGKVTTEQGRPVSGAILDVWQTNGLGRYHHPSDPIGKPIDPNFQGSAVIRADTNGDYRIRTVVPLPYERRQRHIHFDVRGEKRLLVTQMFFPGEPNEHDTLFPTLRNEVLQRAVTAEHLGTEAGVKKFRWNIVLAGE
jgi:protocatechuate 3,4-dioxygenase, beta subunit